MNAEPIAGPGRSAHRHVLLIGGQRCGTTWLQQVLTAEPSIVSPRVVRPEPKFFLDHGTHEDYDRLFDAPTDGRWLLDKSTTYLEHAPAASWAAAAVPDADVIAVLRDPVQRAYSNWKLSRRHELETLTFGEAMTPEAQRRPFSGLSTSPFHYIRRGCYVELLAPWLREFGARVTLLQYEQMVGPGGSRYLRERLAPLGEAFDRPWDGLPSAINAIADEPLRDEERATYAPLFRAANEPLASLGIDLELWSH